MSGNNTRFNILINAYAVSPNWGSEQGMGWNWVINIAKYCNVYIITEGEWRDDIKEAIAKLPQRDNITFYYLPNSPKVRRMCWNQGDWRFYWYYRKWQQRAYKKALEIIASNKINVIHQLNMVGFREPGYLWKIKNIPFVWGPIGGMELMPISYLEGAPFKQRLFNRLKNKLNKIQYTDSPRVRKAIERSSALISAVKGVQDVIQNIYHRDSILINETGVEIDANIIRPERSSSDPLKIIWVGKFDFRKQLPIAIRSIIAMNKRNVEFHICGTGTEATVRDMQNMADVGGIGELCYWHGNLPNKAVKNLMAKSDLLLFTSIMEATSTVVLEAISVGLPVLCFNTCGFGPIVKEFAGITVELSNPSQSVQDFAAILTKIYDNRSILNDSSKQILSKRNYLTWDSKAQKTVELYERSIIPNR